MWVRSPRIDVPPLGARQRCPFCRGDVRRTQRLRGCSDCRAILHRACFEDHGRCTTFGCRGARVLDYVPATIASRRAFRRRWWHGQRLPPLLVVSALIHLLGVTTVLAQAEPRPAKRSPAIFLRLGCPPPPTCCGPPAPSDPPPPDEDRAPLARPGPPIEPEARLPSGVLAPPPFPTDPRCELFDVRRYLPR